MHGCDHNLCLLMIRWPAIRHSRFPTDSLSFVLTEHSCFFLLFGSLSSSVPRFGAEQVFLTSFFWSPGVYSFDQLRTDLLFIRRGKRRQGATEALQLVEEGQLRTGNAGRRQE